MIIKRDIDFNRVRIILSQVIDDLNFNLSDRLEIYRFIDKLSDSESFEAVANRRLAALKRKKDKDSIVTSIKSRNTIFLKCGFMMKPLESSWELYLNNELFLDNLNDEVARRMALDINVAFLMKVSRESKSISNV